MSKNQNLNLFLVNLSSTNSDHLRCSAKHRSPTLSLPPTSAVLIAHVAMRLRSSHPSRAALLVSLLPFTIAITLDCERARDKGKTFDLSALGGAKTVTVTEDAEFGYEETAFTIDICKPLKHVGKKDEDCKNGSRGALLHSLQRRRSPRWTPFIRYVCTNGM